MIDLAIGVDIGGTRTKSGLVNIHTVEIVVSELQEHAGILGGAALLHL